MDDEAKMGSQMWSAARRGAGWTLGVGGVVSVAAILRDGPRDAIKAAMKLGMRGREAAAELAEQIQDLYAEAQVERLGESDASDRLASSGDPRRSAQGS